MDHRTLRRVVTLAHVLSYTKAAELLGISQSVLSRSIQEMERKAKVRLFDRDRAGVHLTTVGRTFVERAEALLRESDELDRMLERAAGGADGKVAIGMPPLLASALLPSVLAQELSANPDLDIFVAVRNTTALVTLLLNEQIEVLICPGGGTIQEPLLQNAPVKATFFGWYPLSLLVRRGHPLVKDRRNLDGTKFPVVTGRKSPDTAPFPDFYWDYIRGAEKLVVESYEVLSRITEETDAIWMTSSFAAADALSQGRLVELVPPEGDASVRWRLMMYSLEGRSISPAALRLRDRMQARLRTLWRETSPE